MDELLTKQLYNFIQVILAAQKEVIKMKDKEKMATDLARSVAILDAHIQLLNKNVILQKRIHFVLTVKFRKDFYYVADLHGSLSKNIADSMIFINKENALTYAGAFEAKLEEKFMMPISVYVKEIS